MSESAAFSAASGPIDEPSLLSQALQAGASAGMVATSGMFQSWSLLHVASYAGHAASCQLLLSAGAPIDARDKKGDTPLHKAVGKGHAGVVRALLLARANPAATNSTGIAPLHAAEGQPEILSLLRNNRSDEE